jgi:hypothetical protein
MGEWRPSFLILALLHLPLLLRLVGMEMEMM